MAFSRYLLQFRLEGQTISTAATQLLVEFSRNVYEFFFEPCDDFWESNREFFAVFKPSFGQMVIRKLEDWQCVVPVDALTAPWVQVGVYAKDGNKIFPTSWSSRLAVADGTTIKEE